MGMDTIQGVEKEKPKEYSVDEGWEYKRVEKDYSYIFMLQRIMG